MHDTYGCEVHSFDPSMTMASQQRREHAWFYRVGLSNRTQTGFDGSKQSMNKANEKGWAMSTLGEMMSSLNHQKVDILKIDIEGGEWDSLAQILAAGAIDQVDQLVMEIHYWLNDAKGDTSIEKSQSRAKLITALEENGFAQFTYHTNPYGKISQADVGLGFPFWCCYEVGFVRVKPTARHTSSHHHTQK